MTPENYLKIFLKSEDFRASYYIENYCYQLISTEKYYTVSNNRFQEKKDMFSELEQYDPQIFELITQEQALQSGSLRLIPSENYVSRAVMTATGSCLTNRYSEGYHGKRYYEGQQVTDLIETFVIESAKKIFKADHANV
jgi:hypothetical protein